MNKVSPRFVLSIVALTAVAAVAVPAVAHSGKGGGKKPMGTIASFDGTALTVTTTDGDSIAATVTDDTQIKVEHRGHHARGKGHGNPSRGSTDSLTAGTFVLRLKVSDDDIVEKIRVRPPPAPTATATPVPTETASPSPDATPAP